MTRDERGGVRVDGVGWRVHVQPTVDDRGPYCEKCGRRVDPNGAGTWTLTIGWTERRRRGGTHAVAEPRYLARYRCRPCHDNGVQENLL